MPETCSFSSGLTSLTHLQVAFPSRQKLDMCKSGFDYLQLLLRFIPLGRLDLFVHAHVDVYSCAEGEFLIVDRQGYLLKLSRKVP